MDFIEFAFVYLSFFVYHRNSRIEILYISMPFIFNYSMALKAKANITKK